MRRWFFLILVGGVLTWGATRWGARSDETWSQVAPGVEVRVLRVPGEAGGAVVALRMAPSRIKVAVANPVANFDAETWRRKHRAIAATNGGFFDADGRSLGARVSDGTTLSRQHGESWGVFWTEKSRRGWQAHITPTARYAKTKTLREAVQCGPRLVENGRVLALKPQWARRTALGISRDGRVILAVADGEVSLQGWAWTPLVSMVVPRRSCRS
jgi:exopolysaccharide biosynthesis protein